MTGTVKNIADKGYGFIKAENGQEYFFHRTGFRGDWDELYADVNTGDKVHVEFDPTSGPKGTRAENVERLDERS